MAAFNYSRPRATASRLITKFGQAGAIRHTTSSGPVYAPVQTTDDLPCTLVAISFSAKDVDGTRIKAGDVDVYLSTSGLTIEPSTADKILIGGVVHSIVTVGPLSPAGTVVYYRIQARR